MVSMQKTSAKGQIYRLNKFVHFNTQNWLNYQPNKICDVNRLTFEQVLVEEYKLLNWFAVSVDETISHWALQVENLKRKENSDNIRNVNDSVKLCLIITGITVYKITHFDDKRHVN